MSTWRTSDECYTPADWLRCAREVLGTIDLDPASCSDAQALVRARRFFAIEHDGLARKWRGRVWLNPPYSRPGPWVDKLIASYQSGEVSAALALLNARTGSAWFHALAAVAWRVEKRKRIRFYGPGSGKGGHGRMDSAFFYLGPDPARFVAVFGVFGLVVPPAVTQAVTRGCTVCARSLDGLRADASVCSSRCRQRAYRVRVSLARDRSSKVRASGSRARKRATAAASKRARIAR